MNMLSILPVYSLMVCTIVAKNVGLDVSKCVSDSAKIEEVGSTLSACVTAVSNTLMEMQEPLNSTLLYKYCTELPKILVCIENAESAINGCSEDDYIIALKSNLNINRVWINRVCNNNAEIMINFSEHGGLQCIQNEVNTFRNCSQYFISFLKNIYNKCQNIYNLENCLGNLLRDQCLLSRETLLMMKSLFDEIYESAKCSHKSLSLI